MIESRLAIKYATALFRAAKRAGEVQTISDDLRALSRLLRTSPNLKNFMESPQVLEGDKKKLIASSLKPSISEVLFSFLLLVIEKHRIGYLLSMAEEFDRLVKEDQGILEARLITARSLDETLLDQFRQELEEITGKRVEIETGVEPRLIGGVVVMVGGKVIDWSIRHQLDQLKEQMSALKVHESA
jgi:F-type H+-transporting ATPase subunit delta